MKSLTVKQLAGKAGVSVRTLHHYDELGLLRPSERSEAGYRLYAEEEWLRLQQILLFREMELPLADIKAILDRPGFNIPLALSEHRKQMLQKVERFQNLIRTIDVTLLRLKEQNPDEKMKTEELYEGFRKEEAEAYRSEAKRRWGNEFEASEKRLKAMDKNDFGALKQEGITLVKKLAGQMHLDPGHQAVQETVQAYFEHQCRFNPINKERFLALGEMYVEDPRFTAYYEQHAPGLALFLREAIRLYCGA